MAKITVSDISSDLMKQYSIVAESTHGIITGDYFPAKNENIATYILPGFSADKNSFMTPVHVLKEKDIGGIVMNLNGQGSAQGRFNGKEIVETTKEIMPAIRSELGLETMGSLGVSTGGIAVLHEGAQNNSASDAVMTISAPMKLEDCKGVGFIKGLAKLGPVLGHGLFKICNTGYALAQIGTNAHYKEKYAKYFLEHLLSTSTNIGATRVNNVTELAEGFKDTPLLFTESTYKIEKPTVMVWGTRDKISGAHEEAYRSALYQHGINLTQAEPKGNIVFAPEASHTMNTRDRLGKIFCSDGTQPQVKKLMQHFFSTHLAK